MDLDRVIAQIRQYSGIFGNRVAGAAELAAVQQQTWMSYPSAYVIPRSSEATDNDSANGLYQLLTETFLVVAVLDNSTATASGDRRGQTAATSVHAVQTSLLQALLNWQPDPQSAPRGISFGGYEIADMDQARLFVEFRFSSTRLITGDDGFQPAYPDLVGIDLSVQPQDDGA